MGALSSSPPVGCGMPAVWEPLVWEPPPHQCGRRPQLFRMRDSSGSRRLLTQVWESPPSPMHAGFRWKPTPSHKCGGIAAFPPAGLQRMPSFPA